jgi:hypothetical protein
VEKTLRHASKTDAMPLFFHDTLSQPEAVVISPFYQTSSEEYLKKQKKLHGPGGN